MPTVQELVTDAKCLCGLGESELLRIIAANIGGVTPPPVGCSLVFEDTSGSFQFLDFDIVECISFPNLVTTGEFTIVGCALLSSLELPVWLPTDGMTITVAACALDATSVNLILARCVAAGVTTCNIDLSGGTSSAPTGQGLIDKADLITAGNAVATN